MGYGLVGHDGHGHGAYLQLAHGQGQRGEEPREDQSTEFKA